MITTHTPSAGGDRIDRYRTRLAQGFGAVLGVWCKRIAALCLAVLLLAGCAPVVVGVLGVGVSEIGLDRRSLGQNLDDQTLTLRVLDAFGEAPELANARINVTTHNGVVLLTGDLESEIDRARIEDIVIAQGAATVLDRLTVTDQPGFFDRANDLRIEAQIKAQLALDRDTPGTSIKLVSERGRVYLLGLVTEDEAQAAAEVVASVPGVEHIVLAFEYIQ